MHARLKSRIARIEKALPKPPPTPIESPVPLIEGWLAKWGVERLPNESLAETTARAMGISCPQLRALLQRLAAGLE